MSGFEIAGVLTSAVQCADVALRLWLALAKFESERRRADSTVAALEGRVKHLYSVVDSVRCFLEAKEKNRSLDGEEGRIIPLIRETLKDCRNTLEKFEDELKGIHGAQQLERLHKTLRTALVALKLNKMGRVVDIFERDVDAHLRTVQIHLSCLHESSITDLTKAIRDDTIWLSTQSQNIEHRRSLRKAQSLHRKQPLIQNHNPFDVEETSDVDSGSDDESIDPPALNNLRESITVAERKVMLSRPGSIQDIRETEPRRGSAASSSRAAPGTSVPDLGINGATIPPNAYPDSIIDDTTLLEVLTQLVNNFSGRVEEELHARRFDKAETFQLDKIAYLEEGQSAYKIEFDISEAKEKLVNILHNLNKYDEADRICHEMLNQQHVVMEPTSDDIPPRLRIPPLGREELRSRSEWYHNLAKTALRRYDSAHPPECLSNATLFAKRAVKLYRYTLMYPNEENKRFQAVVETLVQSLDRQGKEVEADTYRELYLGGHMETPPLSPPDTPQTLIPWSSNTMPLRPTAGMIDAHDNNGMTHLVSSIKEGQIAAAHWALEHGADAEEKCHGKTPLLYAVQRKDTTMVEVLRHYRSTINLETQDDKGRSAIAIAAEQGDSLMIDTLLSLGANIESTSPGQMTPLMIAAQFGKLEAVKALIRGRPNCKATDQEGWSALHHAVHGPDHRNVQAIIQYLINHEVDVNARCRGDVTPLHMAVTDQKMFAIETLLENNADLTAKDSGGHTCLHVAVEENYADLVVLLVNKGAVWEGKIPRDVPSSIKDILKRNISGVDLALERKDSAISSGSRRFRLGSLHLPSGRSRG